MRDSYYDARLKSILSSLRELRKDDLEKLADQVCSMLSKPSTNNDNIQFFCSPIVECCNKCGSVKISKFGKTSNGKQRYRCNDCGHTFTATSSSLFS